MLKVMLEQTKWEIAESIWPKGYLSITYEALHKWAVVPKCIKKFFDRKWQIIKIKMQCFQQWDCNMEQRK